MSHMYLQNSSTALNAQQMTPVLPMSVHNCNSFVPYASQQTSIRIALKFLSTEVTCYAIILFLFLFNDK